MRVAYSRGLQSPEERQAKLIYVANVSFDSYIEDAHGRFEWTAPTDEVFTFITGTGSGTVGGLARAVSGIRVSAAADKGHDRHLTRPA